MRGGVHLEGLEAEAETQRMNAWIDGKESMLVAQCLGRLVIGTSWHVRQGRMIDINCAIAMEVSQIQANHRNTTGKTYLVIRLAGDHWVERKAIECAIWRKSR
jgi:hypothetical protein